MQVKTFIYGTPLGFNFYEDDSQYKDYFKSFYISSREGRRLMINRLDNGETSYNFLCYRIAESGNRPNAFFGMSLVLGDYTYCADFGKLYNWFNFLFDKLVDERNLISKIDSGLRYNVSKFIEDAQDVEWLKANLPNILSSSGMRLYKYDTSFLDKKTGKIMLLNPDDKPETMLTAFKQNRWICLTPFVVSDNDCPELDYGEMSTFLDDVTKQLLPIAINPEEKHIPLLKKIYAESKENSQSISEYLEKSRDEENKKLFSELGKRYYDIWAQQLPKIVEKIKGDKKTEPPTPPTSPTLPTPSAPKTKVCARCGRTKPLSAFADGDNICIECHSKKSSNPHTRICAECGKEKSISDYEGGDTVCRQCRNAKRSIIASIPSKYLYLGIAVVAMVLVVVCVAVFVPKNGSDNVSSTEGEQTRRIVQTNRVEEDKYRAFISKSEFVGAFNYIKEKENRDEYLRDLKLTFIEYLSKIDKLQTMTDALIMYYEICSSFQIDQNDWLNYAEKVENDFEAITKYLQKATLTTKEKNICQELISKYNKQDNPFCSRATAWKSELSRKRVKDNSENTEKQGITVIVYNDKWQKVKEYSSLTEIVVGIVPFALDGYVDVYCKNTPLAIAALSDPEPVTAHKQRGKNPPFRIKPTKAGRWVYQCDDVQITITVVKPNIEEIEL